MARGFHTAREKAASAEDKVTRLEQEIGTLNMDKEFFKNRASQMQEQVKLECSLYEIAHHL
jgi:hypothetical protein